MIRGKGASASLQAGTIFRDGRFRDWATQAMALALLAAGLFWLGNTAAKNLAAAGISNGFGFLLRESGFAIGETAIDYTAADTYLRALAAGLLNTAKVALLACALTTFLGTCLGVMRLSLNPLVARSAGAYVEAVRNTPLLLQLFFWYSLLIGLPAPRNALSVLGGALVMSNQGIVIPAVHPRDGSSRVWLALVAILALMAFWRWLAGRSKLTTLPMLALTTSLMMVCALLAYALEPDFPQPGRFAVQGGATLTVEFVALLVGLVAYYSGYVAEIVRAGLQAVKAGQWEGASALGLRRMETLRLVVIPQARRIALPPLISSYIDIVKDSSLAVAIGFPDLLSVANTTMNQTGQALEVIFILMSVYLTINLSLSALVSLYNHKLAAVAQ